MRFSRRIVGRVRELVGEDFIIGSEFGYVKPEHRELVLRLFHTEKPESFLRAMERFLDIYSGHLPDREEFG